MNYYAKDGGPYLSHKKSKYIRKYKSRNGKWVYVYANKSQHKSIRRARSKGEEADIYKAGSYEAANYYINEADDARASGNKDRQYYAIKKASQLQGDVYRYDRLSKDYKNEYDQKLSSLSVSGRFKTAAKKGKNKVNSILKTMSKLPV